MRTKEEISAKVAPSRLQELCPAGVIISRVSLTFTEGADEECERKLDELLNDVGETQLYLVGDFINYLARTKGEAIARARINESYSPETRRQAAWVCKNVAPERRLISPSYSHSALVASLDPIDQEIWLTRASENKWKVKEMRAELRQREARTKGAPDQSPADPAASRAWQSWEQFRAWFQANSPSFDETQKNESDAAVLPFVTDVVARLDDDDFERIYQARVAFREA